MRNISLHIFTATLALAIVATACKKPESGLGLDSSKDSSLSAVVVFSVGESKIEHSDGTVEKAKLGVTVKTGDRIETGVKGKVDLQFPSGSSIRIAPGTTLDFARLAMNTEGGSDSQVALSSGKVFADVKKTKKTDSFSVVTPTAIAGVRGTSFIVENNAKTGKAKVKVLEGSVATAPRIPALDKLSAEQIDANEDLKKLRDSIQEVEIVLEKGQESSISSNDKKLAVENIDTLDIQEATVTIGKKKANIEPARFTKSEEQELKTIVKVDEKTAKEMVDLNNQSASTDDATKLAEIEKKKKGIEEKLATKQEAKKKEFETSIAKEPKPLKDNREIVSYYERIEKITMVDGSSVVGAIVNQEDDVMIVHTEQGIKRIKLDDINEVIYDYQTKTRF